MKKNIIVILIAGGVGFSLSAQRICDPLFTEYPNSGINMEALQTNPVNGAAYVGDFNEDGLSDILIMGPNYEEDSRNYITLLANNEGKSFTRNVLSMSGVSLGLANGSITATRVDSKKYLVALQGGTTSPATASNSKAMVGLLQYVTSSRVKFTKLQELDYGLYKGDILFIDLNKDGAPDIVQFGGGKKVYAYLNDGNNTFTLSTEVAGLKGTVDGKAVVCDVNNDGIDDILSVDQQNGLMVYLNSGNNSFTATKVSSRYSFKRSPRIATGDFDKDGNVDIVAFDTDGMTGKNSVAFFYGKGDGEFEETSENKFEGVDAAAVTVADFNNDGNLDVLYSGCNYKVNSEDEKGDYTAKAYILLGDGNRNFASQVKSTPKGYNPDIFTLSPILKGCYLTGNFDGDGKPDILALGTLGNTIAGKTTRQADLFYSSASADFGTPIEDVIPNKWTSFPYSQVRLTDSRVKQAMDKEMAYLKSLEVNRLFANTLKYNKGDNSYQCYGGWEEGGYGNSFAHYLSAVSMAYAATGDTEMLERANQCVDIMADCQDVMGDGLFSFADGTTWSFDKVAKAKNVELGKWDENGHPWDMNGQGIFLYGHHKVFACLRDAYIYTGNEKARISFLKLCDWVLGWIQNFDETNMQKILETEHGGMVEVLTDAYTLSGKQKYLDGATRFLRKNFLDAMSNNRDDLSGRHSNFHIPMALGSAVYYRMTGNETNRLTAHNFFHIVHDHHTLCNGGNGNNERFGTPDLLSYRLGMRGPETCSSYNMLKLAKELFCQEGSADYMDYYERTLYNHILATLSTHSDAGVCYYTSLKAGTFRMYDNLYNSFWCCVGTGMESHVKYVDAIYFHKDDELMVNLYIPSTLSWKEKGLKLSMETTFPESDIIKLKVTENESFNGKLSFRYPSWAEEGSLLIKVNGSQQKILAKPGQLASIDGSWSAGTEIEITLPCRLRLEDIPDDVNVSALFYGPVLLAGDMGEVGQLDVGGSVPSETIANPAPEAYFLDLKASRSQLDKWIERGEGLTFTTKGLAHNYTLQPFYDIHHRRYSVYWKVGDDVDIEKSRELVPDYVLTGVTESEIEHNETSSGSNTGTADFSFWGPTYNRFRDASAAGFTSYTLNLLPEELPQDKQYYLQLTYFGDEPDGYGNFKIYVDGTEIASVGSITRLARLDFAQRYYPIPRNCTDGKQKITVKFSDGRLSLYGVKLTTTDNLVEAKKDGENTPSAIFSEKIADSKSIWYNNGTLHIVADSDSTVRLFNSHGQIIWMNNNQKGHTAHSLDLPKGTYVVQCNLSKEIIRKKIII